MAPATTVKKLICVYKDSDVPVELATRSQRVVEIKRRLDSLSVRVDNATRLSHLLRHCLVLLHTSLHQFIDADLRAVMRRTVSDIKTNNEQLQRLQSP